MACYGKDIRLPYCRTLHLFLCTRQGLGLRLSFVSLRVGVNQKLFFYKNNGRKYK